MFAAGAVADLQQGVVEGAGEFRRAFAVVLQEVVGDALGGFWADVGQHFQGVYQAGKGVLLFGHGFSSIGMRDKV